MYYSHKGDSKEQDQEGKTILVVEDDDNIGPMLIEALTEETSYRAMLVSDGLQALQVARLIKPNLFITDYRLPHMTGLELYDRLHLTNEMANTPAIIMSARLPEEEVKKRRLIGIHKPFDLDELLDTVERLLK
jgi:DNA-binding response OmpR family regulator